MQFNELKIPPLREDLELIPGGVNAAGDETYIVRDVKANRYIRIGADIFKIMAHWEVGASFEDFIKILQNKGVDVTLDELKDSLQKLSKAQLIEIAPELITKSIIEKGEKKFKNTFEKFIHNYLFFKIPLFYPDRFIKDTLIYSDFFFSRTFILFSLSLAAISIFFLIPQLAR